VPEKPAAARIAIQATRSKLAGIVTKLSGVPINVDDGIFVTSGGIVIVVREKQ